MEIVFVLCCIIILTFFGIAIGLLVNIRLLLTEIYHHINKLETKFRHIPLPDSERVYFEKLTYHLKRLFQRMQRIKPNED